MTEQFRDDFEAAFAAGPGEHLLKIQGPDLDRLAQTAERARKELMTIAGVEQVRLHPIVGQAGLVFRVDPEKCRRFGVTPADVNSVITSALRGRKVTTMIEGEKMFDLTLRFDATAPRARPRSWMFPSTRPKPARTASSSRGCG